MERKFKSLLSLHEMMRTKLLHFVRTNRYTLNALNETIFRFLQTLCIFFCSRGLYWYTCCVYLARGILVETTLSFDEVYFSISWQARSFFLPWTTKQHAIFSIEPTILFILMHVSTIPYKIASIIGCSKENWFSWFWHWSFKASK